jgi:Ca2+-binding EF-hand superfamily protein
MTLRSGATAIALTLMLAGAHTTYAQGQGQGRGRSDTRIAGMDRNGDGVITREEWRGSTRAFQNRDWNNDGVLSGDELRPGAQRRSGAGNQPDTNAQDRDSEMTDWTERGFNSLDRDRDNRITLEEWRFNVDGFRRADHNHDGVLSRAEFLGTDATTPQSGAYRAGYDRGLVEGRAAGREDRERKQGWDLEGQRELETADSGYEPRLGTKPDYQAGYRAGFRRGYGEGWGPR